MLALCPGAEFGRAKKWPERHYASVAARHIEAGGQVWLFGSKNDSEACATIAAELPSDSVVSLAGKTSLQQAVALLSQVQKVVSNDSGLMHVAAALGRPLVALFGSTSPDYTPPLGEQCAVIKADIDCRPVLQTRLSLRPLQMFGRHVARQCLGETGSALANKVERGLRGKAVSARLVQAAR